MKALKLQEHVAPIQRESMADKVTYRILSLIKAGNLRAGDKLPPEKELVALFDVSRPTLREALKALSILGITTTKKGGRCYISALQAKDLLKPLEFFIAIEENSHEDIFECRQIIECQMVAMAAMKVSDEHISEFERLIEIQKNMIDDPVSFRMSDQKFHELLAEVAGNPVLSRISDSMYNMGMELRRQACEMDGVIAQSINDHIAIVDALKTRDALLASEMMKTHLINIEQSTLQVQKLNNSSN